LFVYVSFVLGIIISLLGIAFIRPVASALGAEGELLDRAVFYGRIILLSLPFYILQLEFQSFFVTAEKPQLGLVVTLIAGCNNILLDFLLVGVLKFGLTGAATATAISETLGGLIPLIYFSRPNTSLLRLTKTSFDGKALLKACTNGSSELMSNVSMSLVSMLYNIQLLKYADENGVAAYGVMMYVGFIFNSAFIGYSIGTAPITGYNFGAKNRKELRSLRKKSFVIIGVLSLFMLTASQLLAPILGNIFVGYDPELLKLTVDGFRIFAFSFLFSGFAIFGSGFFTALNDGLTSAIISFMRTLVFQIAAVMLLPLIFGINGIWFSVIVAEVMAVTVFGIFFIAKQKKYGY
jgi:putative MATE family efflux protein